MIVASDMDQLLVRGVDPTADLGRPSEVHRSALERRQSSRGQLLSIGRGISLSIDLELVTENRADPFTREVEEGVVRQADDRRMSRLGSIVDAHDVVRGERVDDFDLELAGIALFAVGARPPENDRHPAVDLMCSGVPETLVEPTRASVEVVGSLVAGQLVPPAGELEPSAGDAVRVPADDRAEVCVRRREISLERSKPEDDVCPNAASVGHFERLDDAAVGEHREACRRARQDETVDRLPIRRDAKGRGFDLQRPVPSCQRSRSHSICRAW